MSGATLYSAIEELQGETPFGRVLDAGTGLRSLRWIIGLETDSWTAVTGTRGMAARAKRVIGEQMRPRDRLEVGNWAEPEFLAGQEYDTVLADHLLGAIEGFAPFFQTALFARLRALTARRLYVTGMEPYVVERPRDEAGALIWEIGRYRDACVILSGQKPYREFPMEWVLAELRRSGFETLDARRVAVGYQAYFVNSQIEVPRAGLERLADQAVARALIAHGEALRARALAHIESNGPLGHMHYVIAAEPV